VDLRDPENQPSAIHARFDQRAFNIEERDWLTERFMLGPEVAHRARWRLWAAKESAFKVARKLDPGVSFHPRAFGVSLGKGPGAVVRHAIGRFDVWLSGGHEWVHAMAAPMVPEPRPPASRLRLVRRGLTGRRLTGREPLGRGPGGSEAAAWEDLASLSGARVRAVARSALAAALSKATADVEIMSFGRIPVAVSGRARLPVDLSLSHHGRFVACAWHLTGGDVAPRPRRHG